MIFVPKRSLVHPRMGPPFRRGICHSASQQALLGYGGAGGAAAYQVGAIDLNGTTQSHKRTVAFTGEANSTKGIISCWFLPDFSSGGFPTFRGRDSGSTVFMDLITVANGSNLGLSVVCSDSLSTTLLSMQTTTGLTVGSWHHFYAAWDVSVAGARFIYVDGVADLSVSTFTNGSINYAACTEWALGGTVLASDFDGGLAEFYFAPGQYLDPSTGGNLAKFRSASNHPVDLGATGSTPTGSAPLIHNHIATGTGVAADWATNRSGAGNWTIVGAPPLRGSSP